MFLFNAFPAWPFGCLWLMDKDVYKWIGFRNIDSEQIHLTHWKDLKKSRKNNKLTQITLCLQSNFILHKSSPYLMRYFSGDIWKTNLNCLQCEQSLRRLFSGELFTVLYLQAECGDISNTLFTHMQTAIALPACASKLSLRMTQVSNENNINRPSSAQSRAIIISAQSRRRKEAWGESRALWVGIMHIKKMSMKSTSLHEHTEGVAMCVWAIKRCYWQCWLSNMYGGCP